MESPVDDFGADAAQHFEEGNESNAALLQLQDAFVSALTSSGVLGKIRAELRATALSLLRGDEALERAAVGDVLRPATLAPTSKVALLLLYDFLQHHHLRQTAGVLEVEGSVHLLSSEQDALFGDLTTLPGEGPLLERLIDAFHSGKCHPQHDAADRAAGSSEKLGDAPPLPTVDAEESGVATAAHPENEDVLRELEAYEPSVAFSDASGTLDSGERCDEVEIV